MPNLWIPIISGYVELNSSIFNFEIPFKWFLTIKRNNNKKFGTFSRSQVQWVSYYTIRKSLVINCWFIKRYSTFSNKINNISFITTTCTEWIILFLKKHNLVIYRKIFTFLLIYGFDFTYSTCEIQELVVRIYLVWSNKQIKLKFLWLAWQIFNWVPDVKFGVLICLASWRNTCC